MKLKTLDYNIFEVIKNKFPKINYELYNNNYRPSNIINSFNNIKYLVFNPIGRKAILWFTYFEDELLCILNICNTNNYYLIENNFNPELVYNNCVIFGYIFLKDYKQIFTVDKIINYNNFFNNNNYNDKYTKNFEKKLSNFNLIFENYIYKTSNDLLIISLPTIINDTKIHFLFNNSEKNKYYINNIKNLYNIYSVSIYDDQQKIGNCNIDDLENIINSSKKIKTEICNNNFNKNNNNNNFNKNNNNNNFNKNNNITNECYFKIKAGMVQDEYFAYTNNNLYYCTLLINSYKISKFMNSQFRIIKENDNLDLIEESDEEEEFNNDSENKFSDLTKEIIFKCKYNKKFKKWIPIDCNNYNKLSNLTNIKCLEKNINKIL